MEREKRYSIFVIDSDPDTLALFRVHFQNCGHLVHYCSGAREAFGIMQAVYPDICIVRQELSDMDGRVALARIADRFPHAIRIISDDEERQGELLRQVASGIAHRHVCFPWEKNGVAAILNNDLKTRQRLGVKNCWRFLERENLVPIFPEVVTRVDEIVQRDDFDMSELAMVVSADPGIAALILQIVNSSAFPKNAVIGNISHALSYLGVDRLREILLFLCAKDAIPPSPGCLDQARQVAHHSFVCSRLAGRIAILMAPGREKEAATAALLHDIGKLVFFSVGCRRYLDSIAYREAFSVSSTQVEMDEFGISHSELGSSLMLWWNLPMSMVETAANHNIAIRNLSGVGRCVAVADRCLLEAQYGEGAVDTDLDSIKPLFPVDDWRRQAAAMLRDRENPLTN